MTHELLRLERVRFERELWWLRKEGLQFWPGPYHGFLPGEMPYERRRRLRIWNDDDRLDVMINEAHCFGGKIEWHDIHIELLQTVNGCFHRK